MMKISKNGRNLERERERERESKTPGGVKIGIFRFVAVVSFCISTSPLWAADLNSAFIPCQCAIFNSSDSWAGSCFSNNGLSESDKYRLDDISVTGSGNRCKAVAGCKYNTSGQSQSCVLGDSNYYTDYTTGAQNYTPNRCPDSFPSSAAGSWSEAQCYYTTNCAGSSEHSPSTNTPHTCRVYKSGKVVCKNSNQQPSCSGAWSSNTNDGICNLNQASWTDFTYNDDNLDYAYHIEGTGDDAKCYFNTRNCDLFTTSGTVIDVSGTATWDNNQTKWKVNDSSNNNHPCKKVENNKEIGTVSVSGVNNTCDVNCRATATSKPSSYATVNTATTEITYYLDTYYCTSCIDDNNSARVPVAGSEQNCAFPIGTNSNTNHIFCDSSNKSCSCKPVPRGYYKSPSSCSWNNNTGSLPSCTEPCGPGQTTNEGGGATSAADCHYTTQTRFCDAHGCFYLSDLSWDATNHTYNWGGATSTSLGQQ